MHQHTRKAIAKRQPALLNAIRRYNKFCIVLKETRSLECSIPVPKPLPTSLQELRSEMSDLMEDVVIAPPKEGHIHWLEDTNARIGIRAMLKRQRCIEESKCLGDEADNLCRWFGREIASIELALRTPECAFIIMHPPGLLAVTAILSQTICCHLPATTGAATTPQAALDKSQGLSHAL